MPNTDWLNNDGLLVKFGTEEAVPAMVGTYREAGAIRGLMEINLDLKTLVDTPTILSDTSKLPEGALIERLHVIATETAVGGASILDLGVVEEDRVSNHDDDALLAAIALADYNSIGNDNVYTQGDPGHGVLVGNVLPKSYYVTGSWDGAAFTAGKLKIRIYYTMTK
jgi:hypothetical protein